MSEGKHPYTKMTPEFKALRAKVRGYKTIEQRRAKSLECYHKRRARLGLVKPVAPEPPPSNPHAMKRDQASGYWKVGVPSASGRTHWLSTGERDAGKALRVVDASGVQRLSMLARAQCLTADAAAIIMSGHRTTCEEVRAAWVRDSRLDQAKKTVVLYGSCVAQLFKRCDCHHKPVPSITREQLYDYVNDPTAKESTRNVRLAAIRSFYRHAAGHGNVIGNIATTIRINPSLLTVEQREEIPAAPLTEDEYRRIMANRQIPDFWRWATALGWWLGLRGVDVARFEWSSMGDDFAVLYPQKTGRRLVLPLHDPLIGGGELRGVFDEIRLTKTDDTYCFPQAKAEYEHRGSIQRHEGGFAMAAEACGVTGKTFHGLRHSFKIRLFQSGKSIEEISRLMGHASVEMTKEYGRESA